MPQFASRAGEKLEYALKKFSLNIEGFVACDLGSSTGGFVDCLLKYGAKKVYAVDVCYGELSWNLRKDPRVVVLERTNAMFVDLPEKVDLVTVDTGWTKQMKVIPNALKLIKKEGLIISLVKPQYEAGKARLDQLEAERTFKETITNIKSLDLKVVDYVLSPIRGEKGGNYEYLVLIRKDGS